MRTTLLVFTLVLALLGGSLILWHVLDGAPPVASPVSPTTSFDAAQLLVLADADVAATAYADGQLYPIPGFEDHLFILPMAGNLAPVSERPPPYTRVPASNSVMGWPGAVTASPDGAFAYIVENRGPVDASVERFEEGVFEGMPVGRSLTTIMLDSGAVVSTTEVCTEPLSVDRAPSGGWLLVACGDAANELTVVPLRNGRPGPPRAFDLNVPSLATRGVDAGATYAVIHPSGEAAGVILENRGVALVRFSLDAEGIPATAQAEQPLATDRWLSVARWTHSGDHLLAADVAWGPAPADAVFNGDGAIVSFALSPGNDQRGVVSVAQVSKSPEAFDMSRDGSLLAVVNMERTYLPGGWMRLIPGRSASSLSLVAVDAASGELETLGAPVGFRGVLPEDAVFDADGDQIAVVIYQDHDAPRSEGWVEFFEVDRTGPAPSIQPTGRRILLPRGTHDLFVID